VLASSALVGLALLLLLPVALGVRPGLNAEYFASLSTEAAPAVTAVDDEISTAQIERRWPDLPPKQFRVRWFGYLNVPSDGAYTFSVIADDGASLRIDGRTVTDTGPGPGRLTAASAVSLTGGVHAITIDYRQLAGDYELSWTWAHDGGAAEPVPSWRLAPRRRDLTLLQAGHIARLTGLAILMAVVVVSAGVFRQSLARWPRRRPALALLLFFVGMSVLQTWPLASDPAHLSRNDNADTVLNEWALAWVTHQSVTDPLHLFDANIFYPERYTLAFSESMIVQSAMAAPLLWLGASPVLAYNLLLIAGFALNGWVMALIIRRWTGDSVAAVLSGILFAFNSNILTRLPHMQALHVEFLPLALFTWDRLLHTSRVRDAVALGVMVALQALTSVYLLVFTVCTIGAAAAARASDWIGRHFIRTAGLLFLSAAAAAAIAVPFLLPYLWVNQAHGFERSLDDAIYLAATPGSYLASPSRLHYGYWSYRFFDNPSALFPGVTAVFLGFAAFVRGTAVRDPRARMALVVTLAGVLLSFGPRMPGYAALFMMIPIFRVVRVVSSFGYIALMGLAILAGYGAIELRRIIAPQIWPAVAAVLVLLVTIEPLAAPLELTPYTGISRIYDRLRDARHAVVIEMPFLTASAGFRQAPYMLDSTRNWKPMLNGYSGYRPASFYETAERVQSFPAPESIEWLRRRGVTHVFVHLDLVGPDMDGTLAVTPGLREIASDRMIRLYEVE
jgi:hypothetical protein